MSLQLHFCSRLTQKFDGCLQFLNGYTVSLIVYQHLQNQDFQFHRYLHILRQLNLPFYCISELYNIVNVVPWSYAVEDFVDHDAQAPNIALYAVRLPFENLRRHVKGCPDGCLWDRIVLGSLDGLSKAKIGNLGDALTE